MNILAIDIGGTTTKRAIIDETGTLVKKFQPLNTHKGHDLKWLFDGMKDIDLPYECIGLDLPGFYNKKEQILMAAGNLDYHNFDIVKETRKYTTKQVFILNDANAAALGEF